MDKELESEGDRKLSCSDVSKCFKLLESILDGDNIPDSQEILNQKLAKCQPCFEHYHLEKVIKEVLRTKCTKHAVPVDVVARIREKIQDIK